VAQSFWKYVVLTAVISVVAGCLGDSGAGAGKAKTVPLSGKITLDGKPHGNVNLQFLPQSSDAGVRTAYAQVEADGSFSATTYVTGDGIVAGKYSVRIGSEADGASTDPAKMMAAVAGASIETMELDVPAEGLTDIELKFKSAGNKAGAAGGLLGQ